MKSTKLDKHQSLQVWPGITDLESGHLQVLAVQTWKHMLVDKASRDTATHQAALISFTEVSLL